MQACSALLAGKISNDGRVAVSRDAATGLRRIKVMSDGASRIGGPPITGPARNIQFSARQFVQPRQIAVDIFYRQMKRKKSDRRAYAPKAAGQNRAQCTLPH